MKKTLEFIIVWLSEQFFLVVWHGWHSLDKELEIQIQIKELLQGFKIIKKILKQRRKRNKELMIRLMKL